MRWIVTALVLLLGACTFEVVGDGGGPMGLEFQGDVGINGTLLVEGETEHNVYVHGLGMEDDLQGCRMMRSWMESHDSYVKMDLCMSPELLKIYGDEPDLTCMEDSYGCQAFWGFLRPNGTFRWCAYIGEPDCS